MRYEIKGNSLPYLVCYLNKGEKIICEGGSMSWMSPGMMMETSSNGGASKIFSRMFAGEKLFQNIYTAQYDNAMIAFASSFPGSILPIEIKDGMEVICQKGSFLASSSGINTSIHFNQKVGVGLFGGEGFIMQKMTGNGIVFIEIDGSMESYNLKEGEQIVVSTGSLVMIDGTCSMDIQSVQGIKNVFLGGQGLFNTVIKGPGRVVLQSMPISKTADIIGTYLPQRSNSHD